MYHHSKHCESEIIDCWFFLNCSSTPRDPHSFPTRRYSDLVDIDPVILRLGAERHPDRPYSDPRVTVRPVRMRSEEHTSELQSRQYLVCRLLLEKKKIQKTTSNRHNNLHS